MRNDFSMTPDIFSEDWAWLVQYWSSPEVQVVASKNKANRSQQTIKHTGGLRVLLNIEMRRLGAGLMGVYLLRRISSFAPIVGRTRLLMMRNQRKSFQSLRN